MPGAFRDRQNAPVGVDHSTLRSEVSGADRRYTVALTGPADAAWCEAFRQQQADSSDFRKLRLDAATSTVTFLCRGAEGTGHVFDVLERLDALVKLANRQRSGR